MKDLRTNIDTLEKGDIIELVAVGNEANANYNHNIAIVMQAKNPTLISITNGYMTRRTDGPVIINFGKNWGYILKCGDWDV